MEDQKLYDKTSIESLDARTFTRLRPQVYAGDCTYSTQLLVEAIANSVDEYRLGHGKEIDVAINGDTISVLDEAQGFLVNEVREEDGKTVLEAAFSVLNTSGKFKTDGVYEGTSLGSFGIGLKIITFLSHFVDVTTFRDGKTERIVFREGILESRKIGECNPEKSGTFVIWQPSEEFFEHPTVQISKVKTLFKTIACLCPGLTIKLYQEGKLDTTFYSKNGLDDLMDDLVEDKEIIHNRFDLKYEEGKNKLDLVLTYTGANSSVIIPYVNTGLTESGQHISQIKTTITREFNKFFKSKGWLKEKESNLTGEEIQDGLYLIFNITSPEVGYDAQVKTRVTRIDMKPFNSILSESIQTWLILNEIEVKKIFDKATLARKAKEAAKKAKDKILKPKDSNKKSLKEKLLLSEKFVDCQNKNPAARELMLVEGTK